MSNMSFVSMLVTLRNDMGWTQAHSAKAFGISPQYYNDLEHGRRAPSVALVNKICKRLGRGPKGRLEWHIAGAQAHGWEVRP